MSESFEIQLVRWAFRKGFRVAHDGNLVSFTGRVLKCRTNSDGYKNARIRADELIGKRGTRALKVHRLAAYQKFGEAALQQEVRHLNNNPGDNRPENIAFGTHSDNMMDKPREIRRKVACIATKKVTKWDVRADDIRADRARGMRYSDLIAKYGIPKSTLSYLLNKAQYHGPARARTD